ENEWSDRGATSAAQYGLHLSEHSRALCRVGPGFEEPLDDDDAMDEEQARVDSDLESDDDEDDSKIGEATFPPTKDDDRDLGKKVWQNGVDEKSVIEVGSHRHNGAIACATHRHGWSTKRRNTPSPGRYEQHNAQQCANDQKVQS
ncbi:hypothetical protein HAX54_037826, partial [Datura stramonium]|nr:hypothetical protein [Datura stramonium]